MSVSTTLAFIKLSSEKETTFSDCMRVVNVSFMFIKVYSAASSFPLRS
jgi:hypothetical protein